MGSIRIRPRSPCETPSRRGTRPGASDHIQAVCRTRPRPYRLPRSARHSPAQALTDTSGRRMTSGIRLLRTRQQRRPPGNPSMLRGRARTPLRPTAATSTLRACASARSRQARRTLVGASGTRKSDRTERRGRDLNPREACTPNGFRGAHLTSGCVRERVCGPLPYR